MVDTGGWKHLDQTPTMRRNQKKKFKVSLPIVGHNAIHLATRQSCNILNSDNMHPQTNSLVDASTDEAHKIGAERHTFGDTPPGEIEHENGRSFQQSCEERTVNLCVRAIANWAGQEEVGKLRENEKQTSKRVIYQGAHLAQDDDDDPCH